MKERCKHDMLPGYCGFCRLLSSDAAQAAPVNGHDFVALLGRFAPHPEPVLPKRPLKAEQRRGRP